ncbi:MAG: hypothetical protein CAF42_009195 [Nitrospira sp. CG24B]|nr:MAG: hypothetical protein CAF42_009195 [Nitrospira sp. CG24B]
MDRILAECSRAVYRRMKTKREELSRRTTAYRPIHNLEWEDESVSHHRSGVLRDYKKKERMRVDFLLSQPLALVIDSRQRL